MDSLQHNSWAHSVMTYKSFVLYGKKSMHDKGFKDTVSTLIQYNHRMLYSP